MNLNQAQTELTGAEEALKPYQDPDLYNQINQEVMKQWTPQLESATAATGKALQEFLPQFMDIPYKGLAAGTTAADLTPQQKMQYMGQQLGGMTSRLAQYSSLASYLGGKAAEMQNKAQQAAQFGYSTKADAYNRAFQRYQTAWQTAENEKQRAAAAAARGGGGGISGLPEPTNNQNPILARLQTAQAGGENALYKELRNIEAEVGGWENMKPEQQELLSPWWGTWQQMKYGDWSKGMSWDEIQKSLAGQTKSTAPAATAPTTYGQGWWNT